MQTDRLFLDYCSKAKAHHAWSASNGIHTLLPSAWMFGRPRYVSITTDWFMFGPEIHHFRGVGAETVSGNVQ